MIDLGGSRRMEAQHPITPPYLYPHPQPIPTTEGKDHKPSPIQINIEYGVRGPEQGV